MKKAICLVAIMLFCSIALADEVSRLTDEISGIASQHQELQAQAKQLVEQRTRFQQQIVRINEQLLRLEGAFDVLADIKAEKTVALEAAEQPEEATSVEGEEQTIE